MKRSLLAVGLFALAMCLAGCVAVVKEKTWKLVGSPTDEAIWEMNAVSELSFESDRKQGYERIAGRKGLSAEAQIHLVESVLDKLSFDSAKEEVLLTLIANPSFCSEAEQAILDRLDRLAFEISRKKILEAISERKAKQSKVQRMRLTRLAAQASQ